MAYSDRFTEALMYAARLHREQCRKGARPVSFINHLMAVAAIVAEYGGDEVQVTAGLLHDAVEDQGGQPRLDDIRRVFGDEVAEIVEACTDTFEDPKPPWRGRKEAYLAHLREAADRVLLVSAADKLHNSRSIVADLRREGPACFERFKGGRDGTLWYYRSLVEIFLERGPCELAEELARTVETMRELEGR